MHFEYFTRNVVPLPGYFVTRLTSPSISVAYRSISHCGRPFRRHSHTEAETTRHASFTPTPYVSSRSTDPRLSSLQPPSCGLSSISDHEWDLRAGRAVYTLRTTMPKFFEIGLVSSVDLSSSNSRDSVQSSPGDSIYAPNIKLNYSPPTSLSLPSPFPKSLQVEGLPLYHASATFIRHTLSAFNTDLQVELRKLQVQSSGVRHREITLRKGVFGKSRISGTRNEWDVHSTYRLSPQSGLIELHVVESIYPAPHVTFYDGLRSALARLAGVDVEREAGAGVRGIVSNRSLEFVPIREKVGKTERD